MPSAIQSAIRQPLQANQDDNILLSPTSMPSAIQSAIMQPLKANLDDNILLSTSKLVDVQPPTTIGLLATTQDVLEFEVPSTDDAKNYNVIHIPEIQAPVPLPELSELFKAARASGRLLNHYVDFVRHHVDVPRQKGIYPHMKIFTDADNNKVIFYPSILICCDEGVVFQVSAHCEE